MAKAKKIWKSLKHNGPMLAPHYSRIPKKYRLRYGKQRTPILLSPKAEEYAMIYASYLRRNKNPIKILKENFFKDWQKVMNPRERQKIKNLSQCNFNDLINYIEEKAEANKEMTKEQRQKLKLRRETNENKHKVIRVDGIPELLNNYMVEPPGLYIGRGDNKNIGRVKPRLQMKDITINCSDPARLPYRNQWKKVINNPYVSWTASWTDSITQQTKYILLHASSKIKTDSDRSKFNLANKLAGNIATIERRYKKDLSSNDLARRQFATATYLIHTFALRVGNEKKSEGMADTVGCLSLKKEHILRIAGDKVDVNFIGKDSVRYQGSWKVLAQVATNLKEFKGTREKPKIFYEIKTATTLNDYLTEMMPGLTAKVFRTYRATELFRREIEKQFKSISDRADIRLKLLAIKLANLEVAKLLNHRTMTNPGPKERAVQKHEDQIEDLQEKLRQIKNNGSTNVKQKDERIKKLKADLIFKRSELSLKMGLVEHAPQTSKANYIDPRVIVQWCKKLKVPVENAFTKAEQKKFAWAIKEGGERKVQDRGVKRR